MEKKIIKRIKLIDPKEGNEKREEIYKEISSDGGFLPKSVSYNDIIYNVIDFVKKDIGLDYYNKMTNNKEKVSVYPFEGLQRFDEFIRTWNESNFGEHNKYKDVKLPFITIIRKPNPQEGTSYNKQYNIPGFPTFKYLRVPTLNNGIEGYDLYKIPLPVNVDMEFTIRLFTEYVGLLNDFNQKIIELFSSRQFYIFPNGYPMPLVLTEIGDETKYGIDERKFYVQPINIKLTGYVVNMDKAEIVPLKNRYGYNFKIDTSNKNPLSTIQSKIEYDGNYFFINMTFKNASTINEFLPDKTLTLNSIDDLTNIISYKLFIKNNLINDISFPLIINRGNRVRIEIIKENENKSSFLTLNGNIV